MSERPRVMNERTGHRSKTPDAKARSLRNNLRIFPTRVVCERGEWVWLVIDTLPEKAIVIRFADCKFLQKQMFFLLCASYTCITVSPNQFRKELAEPSKQKNKSRNWVLSTRKNSNWPHEQDKLLALCTLCKHRPAPLISIRHSLVGAGWAERPCSLAA